MVDVRKIVGLIPQMLGKLRISNPRVRMRRAQAEKGRDGAGKWGHSSNKAVQVRKREFQECYMKPLVFRHVTISRLDFMRVQ